MEGQAGGEALALRSELRLVRWELERLVEARLQGSLSLTSQCRYQALTAREQWLLGRIHAA